jgi:hypothetical protein
MQPFASKALKELHSIKHVRFDSDPSLRLAATRRAARAELVRKYTPDPLSLEELERALDSLTDNNAHLMSYRQPIDRMLEYLQEYFDPDHPTQLTNLTVCK